MMITKKTSFMSYTCIRQIQKQWVKRHFIPILHGLGFCGHLLILGRIGACLEKVLFYICFMPTTEHSMLPWDMCHVYCSWIVHPVDIIYVSIAPNPLII